MARQEATSRLLYYPTPQRVTDLVATYLMPTPGLMRLADPCVGEGTALRTLADQVQARGGQVQTWGIELSYGRASTAAKVIDTVLPVSFYSVFWGPHTASLIFNNPPYDWSETKDEHGKRLRHEQLFAIRCTPRLVPGGVHILIVQQKMLADETLARHWCGWYSQVLLRRFPAPEFAAFGQVVLFGVAREKYHPPTKTQVDQFMAAAKLDLEPLEQGFGQYALPAAPASAKFTYTPWTDVDLVHAAAPANLLASDRWQRATYVRPSGAPLTPLTPPKIGHLSMLISAGELGIVPLTQADGRQVLVKGTLRKTIERKETDNEGKDGRVTSAKVEERERLQSVIAVLDTTGAREEISGAEAVADFITANASPLADAVIEKNRPFYDWQPTHAEWDALNTVAVGLPPLPGRKERGLFEVQKHFAIAAARKIAQGQPVILNAEMGYGKTASAIATLELRNRWPVLVMCPGHLVQKWHRDLTTASSPAHPIQARIITKPARAEPSHWHTTVWPVLQGLETKVLETHRYQVQPLSQADSGLRRAFTITVPASRRSAIGPALKKILTLGGRGPNKTISPKLAWTSAAQVTVEYADRDDYTLADFFRDLQAGRLGTRAVAICAFEPAKYDAGRATADLPKRWFRIWDPDSHTWLTVQAPTCPGCGTPIGISRDDANRYKLTANVQLVSGEMHYQVLPEEVPDVCMHFFREIVRDEKGKPLLAAGQPQFSTRRCGTRLYNFARWRRVGLARLVQRHYRHRFKVYITDELHEAKSADTDIGTADGRFLSSIHDSLALTGTLFGGTASSLFYLLFRRNPEVRQHYGYKDTNLWVDHYGLWKYRWTESKEGSGRGLSSGVKRWNVMPPQELPGVSPAVIRYLLPITLFGKITDLGYTLPPLVDQVQTVEMGPDQALQYAEADDYLLEQALDLLKEKKDGGMISTWFTTIRFRPMSAFRDESVVFRGDEVMFLPGINHGFLPKEIELARLVGENHSHGRKTLVFVEQTATRDIRHQLAEALRVQVPQVRVKILSAGDMAPAKREMWLTRNADEMDCLLVNAGLVKTGLDLVMFSDIVFYETNTSLYTVWQAMRRVWRLGQKNNVTTTFLAYTGTAEEALLDLMGAKMKSAMLLYGDNAAGALIDDDGEDDLARKLIQQALEGKAIRAVGDINGRSLFGGETIVMAQVTESPLGSPEAHSPMLTVLAPEPLGVVQQLDLFGGMTVVEFHTRRR